MSTVSHLFENTSSAKPSSYVARTASRAAKSSRGPLHAHSHSGYTYFNSWPTMATCDLVSITVLLLAIGSLLNHRERFQVRYQC